MQMPVVLLPNFLQLKCFLTWFTNKLWLFACVSIIKVLLEMCFLIKSFVAFRAYIFLFNPCTDNFMLLNLYKVSAGFVINLTLENIIIVFIAFRLVAFSVKMIAYLDNHQYSLNCESSFWSVLVLQQNFLMSHLLHNHLLCL